MINNYEGVRVQRVAYGNGLFAARQFDAEEMIGEVKGRIINDPNYSSDYAIDYTDTQSLEPDEPFCYINHSCDPNCQLVCCEVFDDKGNQIETTIIVESIREIGTEEQLTIDYGWPADEAIPCECGSRSCRGWIVNEDELEKVLKKHLQEMEFWAE